MSGQRGEDQVQFNLWLGRDLRDAARARAKDRDEDLAEVVRRGLRRYVQRGQQDH